MDLATSTLGVPVKVVLLAHPPNLIKNKNEN